MNHRCAKVVFSQPATLKLPPRPAPPAHFPSPTHHTHIDAEAVSVMVTVVRVILLTRRQGLMSSPASFERISADLVNAQCTLKIIIIVVYPLDTAETPYVLAGGWISKPLQVTSFDYSNERDSPQRDVFIQKRSSQLGLRGNPTSNLFPGLQTTGFSVSSPAIYLSLLIHTLQDEPIVIVNLKTVSRVHETKLTRPLSVMVQIWRPSFAVEIEL